MRNFGDDLFSALVDGGAIRQFSDYNIVKSDRGQISVESARILSGSPLAARLGRVGVNILDALSADRVVYAGGSVFSKLTGTKRAFLILSRMGMIRNAAIGISIGPFNKLSDRNRVGELLSLCVEVVVRDKRSAIEAQSLGIENAILGGDLVALWPNMLSRRPPKARNRSVTICPCSTASWTVDDYVAAALTAAEAIGATSFSIVSLNTHLQLGDSELCQAIHHKLQGSGKKSEFLEYDELGLDATIDALARSGFVVSGRLHGAIVSYLVGVPFLLVLYHQKCVDFLDDVASRSGFISAPRDQNAILQNCLQAPGFPAENYVARAAAAYGRRHC